ncbi:hypothetical protein [Photobacterium chitinilyticum]|uniref:hypothetical protein n=1 Tax=Photobacterium chitinilyticum TaxID=2485123 RepID=UPI0013E8AEFF|nr:hypothetical protein [Photobacterium chitinilyticum]
MRNHFHEYYQQVLPQHGSINIKAGDESDKLKHHRASYIRLSAEIISSSLKR